MELKQILKKRRSIRSFKSANVSDEKLIKIIEAGIKAPTAGNVQPWRFLITKDKTKIEKVADTTYIGANIDGEKNQEWIRKAPVIILACIDYHDSVAKYGEQGKKAAVQDVSAALENMILRIVDLGLASCWISGFREKELKKIFQVPDEIEVLAFLPIAYENKYSSSPSKKKLDEVVFNEVYGKKVKI